MGTWFTITLALFIFGTALANGQDASRPRPIRKSHSTEHLDKLDRDELLDILGQIENSSPTKVRTPTTTRSPYRISDFSTYPPVTAPPRRKYTTPQPSAPLFPTSRRPTPSSNIDELLRKYKNQKGQPSSPTVDDLLRRLRTNAPSAPSAPSSTFNYPGPNFGSNPRLSSSSSSSSSSRGSSSPPYPTSYNSALYPTKGPAYPPYPTSYGSRAGGGAYPTAYGSQPGYGSRAPYPTLRPSVSGSRPYPSLSAGGSSGGYGGSYSPSGTFGGAAPKYATTTKKPKKSFLSKLFG